MLYVLPYGQMSLWGNYTSPRCNKIIESIFISFYFIIIYNSSNHIIKRILSAYRIGPHNYDIMSIIYGSLLGDRHAERRRIGNGTRISFNQEAKHKEYLL